MLKSFTAFLLISTFVHSRKEILLDYEEFNSNNIHQSQLKYFYDIEDGYFLDVGGFHPFRISTTHPLVNRGWNGLTVEASPWRARNFFDQRNGLTNINSAIGK